MAQLNPFRSITQRLNSTPVEELSRCAGVLAASILNCRHTLSLPENAKSDTSIQLEKLTTRISSLLQDRTQEARYTGIVLAKAVIEAVGLQSLGNSAAAWVRNLLSCLSKPDPPQVKRLAVVAIARIFILTWDKPALTREITSSALPAYMTACLNNIKPTTVSKDSVEHVVLSPLLLPVMQCWLEMMTLFPSTLRPFTTSIRAIVLSLMGQQTTPQNVKEAAFHVYAKLSFCAPKDSSASDWIQSVQLVVDAIHQTADILLRSVKEEWSPVAPRHILFSQNRLPAHMIQVPGVDAIGIEKWVGMHSGFSRMVDLLRMLRTLLTSQQPGTVELPLAQILDVTARIAAVLWPTKTYFLRENGDIGRDEREQMLTNLPLVHCAILELYSGMGTVFGRALAPVSRQVLLQMWDIFSSEFQDDRIRSSVYVTFKSLLQHGSVSLQAQDSEKIATLVQRCCNDLKSTELLPHTDGQKSTSATNRVLKITLSQRPSEKIAAAQSTLIRAAWDLLPVIFTDVSATLMTSSTRGELDQTAILIGHNEALLASVLHPLVLPNNVRHPPSVLPFLSRSVAVDLGYEALIRPRMPILRGSDFPNQLENVGVTDEASDGQSSSLHNMDLHRATDHTVGEVEGDSTMSNILESSSIRKREHGQLENTALEPDADASKRFKSSLNFEPVTSVERISDVQPEDMKQTITAIKSVSGNEFIQEAAAVSDIETKNKSTVPTIIKAIDQDTTYPHVGPDDESDDSEIPQIDATLSSDEGEDNFDGPEN